MLRKILVFGIHLNYTIETIAPICVLVELPKVWQERMAISRDRLWPFKVSNLIKVVGLDPLDSQFIPTLNFFVSLLRNRRMTIGIYLTKSHRMTPP